MLFGAIDVGTNSIHLIVVEFDSTFDTTRVVYKDREMVRLGQRRRARARPAVAPRRWSRGSRRSRGSLPAPRARGAERMRAVATSAVREAENGDEFRVASRGAGRHRARDPQCARRSAPDPSRRRQRLSDLRSAGVHHRHRRRLDRVHRRRRRTAVPARQRQARQPAALRPLLAREVAAARRARAQQAHPRDARAADRSRAALSARSHDRHVGDDHGTRGARCRRARSLAQPRARLHGHARTARGAAAPDARDDRGRAAPDAGDEPAPRPTSSLPATRS